MVSSKRPPPRRTSWLVAAPLALGIASTLLASPTADAAASEDCIAASTSDRERALDFAFRSDCPKPMTCTVGWTVTCEGDGGSITSRTKQSARFPLARGTAHLVTASASSCKQNWRIDDAAWSCDPPKE